MTESPIGSRQSNATSEAPVTRQEVSDASASGVLAVDDIVAGYGNQEILHGISAVFRPGTATAIIGPNGAGKSTLFKTIFGVARAFGGTLSIDDQKVRIGDCRKLLALGVAYVPQVQNVFPSLSVRENLSMGYYGRARKVKGGIDKVVEIFPVLGTVLQKKAMHLSGGQRNMLAVGRALMCDPRYLLVDEATGGLAPIVATTLWQALIELRSYGVAVIAVEQNVHMALEYCEDVHLIMSGRTHFAGASSELMQREDLGRLFFEYADEPTEPNAS